MTSPSTGRADAEGRAVEGQPARVVLAIDPGETIGVAIVSHREGDTLTKLSFQTRNPLELMQRALDWKAQGALDCVVIENFTSAGTISTAGMHTIQQLGYFRLRCEEAGIRIVVQMPQQRKSQLTRAKIDLPKNEQRHMADALAHAYAYLRREYGSD